MKLAILLSRFPYPLERGDKLRAYHQIKSLSKHHEIYLFAVVDDEYKDEYLIELKPFCKEIYVEKITTFQKFKGLVHAYFRGWPLQAGIAYKSSFSKIIKATIQSKNIDFVYCQLIRMAPYCDEIKTPKIIDLMDAFGHSMSLRANIVSFPENKIYQFESNRVKKYEEKCIQHFDLSTIISDNDKLSVNATTNKLKVIPNGIDTNQFHFNARGNRNYDIGFVGNMGYLPNIEAVEYLVQNIAPAYKKKYSKDLKIGIFGARPDQRVKSLASDNVFVSGWLDDIVSAYHDMKILCAPIFSGTGQQNKIIEAMSCGTPVICNDLLNKAIKASKNLEVIIANNTTEIVDAIHLLLNSDDKRIELSINGRLFVENKFDWEVFNEELNGLMDFVQLVQ